MGHRLVDQDSTRRHVVRIVFQGLRDGLGDQCERREVEDAVEGAVARKELCQAVPISDVATDQRRVLDEGLAAGPQIVDHHHRVPCRLQSQQGMAADVSRSARDDEMSQDCLRFEPRSKHTRCCECPAMLFSRLDGDRP